MTISKASSQTWYLGELGSNRFRIAPINNGNRVILCIGSTKKDWNFKDLHSGFASNSSKASTNCPFFLNKKNQLNWFEFLQWKCKNYNKKMLNF